MFFFTTLTCVAIMLLYCVPGFLIVKTKLVKPEAISAFATVLMYVSQPALTVYSFRKMPYSWDIAKNCLIFCGIVLLILGIALGIAFTIFRKKLNDNRYRVYTIATTFSNCTFMGVPLLEALFPNNPEAVMYSISFFVAMSILCWTVGSYIISGDKKFISAKKLFINPAMISVYVAIPLWVTGVPIPDALMECITLVGRMTTPLCMLVLGMRLATVRFLGIINNPMQYLVVGINQIVLPLLTFAAVYFIPMDPVMKQCLVILVATPIASVVLNFAEMLNKGQETAANCVLLGTLCSVVTIPLVSLLL